MNKAKIILSLAVTALACLFIAGATGAAIMVPLAIVLFGGCIAASVGMKDSEVALTICGSISACLKPDCDNPIFGGLDVEVYLANVADVDASTITYDSGNPTLITNWVANSPIFYTYEGQRNSNNDKTTLKKTKYTTNFDHELSMVVFNVNAAAKLQLEKLSRGLVVAIVKNNYKGATGSCKYEVLGLGNGLELATLERDKSNADTQGAFAITLKTPDGYSEPHLPATIYTTNESTTDDIVADLLVTCS